MQSRLLVNVLLLLFVITLVVTVYFSKGSDPHAIDKLTEIDPGSITNISIKHKGRTISLVKSANHWRLTEPVSIAANDFRVESVLKLLTTPGHFSYEENNLSLENFGLDNSKTIITFNNISLAFGIINPLNNLRYVKIDNKVHLIDDFFYPLLSSQIGTLVSLSPLPDNSEIIKLVLPDQILELDQQGLWRSNKELSADAIIETIYNWEHDQAFGVHNYLKRASLGSIEVYLKNIDKPVIFELTDTDPWIIIARPDLDLEYHFNLELYDRLLRPGSSKQPPEGLVE